MRAADRRESGRARAGTSRGTAAAAGVRGGRGAGRPGRRRPTDRRAHGRPACTRTAPTDFASRHPERFFNVGIAEQNMVSIGGRAGDVRLLPVRGDVRELRRPAVRRADPHRPRLSRPAGSRARAPRRHLARLLRDVAPRHRGPRAHALDRRADGGLPVRRRLDRARRCGRRRPARAGLRPARPGREPDVYDEAVASRAGSATRARCATAPTLDRRQRHRRRRCAEAADRLAADGVDAAVLDATPSARSTSTTICAAPSGPGGCWSPRSTT